MTIIYNFDKDKWMKDKNKHGVIFQRYINGIYKGTHKRVTQEEFFTLPKIFVYQNCVSIVTGNQYKGGKDYIKHCKTFDCKVDRINNVIILVEKEGVDEVESTVKKLIQNGVTLKQISKELDFRENSSMNWDDDLFEYSTEELEEIEREFERL